MRLLKNVLFFTTLSFLFFSCQKEVSFEFGKGSSGPAEWEFKEAGKLFKGTMDIASIVPGAVKKLQLTGISVDGDTLTIEVLGSNIIKGVYKTPTVLFSYTKKGTGKRLYANDFAATDKFLLTITSIDTNAAVSGTFNGEVQDTANAIKIITAGKFTAKFKASTTTPSTPGSGDYFPTTANSNWTYQRGTNPDDTSTVLRTGISQTFGGKSYSVFLNDGGIGIDTTRYRKAGGSYYEYISADQAVGLTFGNPVAVEYIFLKDNVAVGSNWETVINNSVGGFPVAVKIRTRIIEKVASATVGAQTYSDVIKSKTDILYTMAGTNFTVGSTEGWYAKGKGLIKRIETDAITATPPDVYDVTRMQVY